MQNLSLAITKAFQIKAPAKRPCPLLLDGICQAYAMRPIACRRFLVCGRQCEAGEDPATNRPEEMIIPARRALDAALLDLYHWHAANYQALGLARPKAGPDAEKLAWMRQSTTFLQGVDWEKVFAG